MSQHQALRVHMLVGKAGAKLERRKLLRFNEGEGTGAMHATDTACIRALPRFP